MEKKFDYKERKDRKVTITLTRNIPFYNKCPVFGWQDCLVAELIYEPDKEVLENSVFRNYFNKDFEERLEMIALNAFNYFYELIEPVKLKLTIKLVKDTNDHDVIISIEK